MKFKKSILLLFICYISLFSYGNKVFSQNEIKIPNYFKLCNAIKKQGNNYEIDCDKFTIQMRGRRNYKNEFHFEKKIIKKFDINNEFFKIFRNLSETRKKVIISIFDQLFSLRVNNLKLVLNNKKGFYLNWKLDTSILKGTSFFGIAYSGLLKALKWMKIVPKTIEQELYVKLGFNTKITLKSKLIKTCTPRVKIIPGINSEAKFGGLNLYFNIIIAKPLKFDAKIDGDFFIKPTKWDSWIKITPNISLNNTGMITIGGSFSGKCNDTRKFKRTCSDRCNKSWKPFNNSFISAQGGQLNIGFDSSGTPKKVQIAVKKAKIGPNEVTGALIIDPVKYKCGVYLKRNRIPFIAVLDLFRQLKFFKKIIPKGFAIKDFELLLSPTGGSVGPVSFPPGFKLKGKIDFLGFSGSIDISAGISMRDLLKGKISKLVNLRGRVKFNIEELTNNIKKYVRKIPLLGSIIGEIINSFRFNYLNIGMGLKNGNADLNGKISFRVFGKTINSSIAANVAMNPVKIAKWVGNKIKDLAFNLGKIIFKGLKIAAKAVANAGKYVAKNTVKAFKNTGRFFKGAGEKVFKFFKSGWNSFAGLFKWKPSSYEKNLYKGFASHHICLKVIEEGLDRLDLFWSKVYPVIKKLQLKDRIKSVKNQYDQLVKMIKEKITNTLRSIRERHYYLNYFQYWAKEKYHQYINDFHPKQFLDIKETTRYQLVYNDKDSGAWLDGSFWRPVAPPGYYILGHVGHPTHAYPNFKTIVVKPLQNGAVRHPLRYEWFWDDYNSGASMNAGGWRPICPGGYHAMGVVFNNSYSRGPAPNTNEIVCLRSDLTIRAKIGSMAWFDRKSGGKHDLGTYHLIPGNYSGYFGNLLYGHRSHRFPDWRRISVYVVKRTSAKEYWTKYHERINIYKAIYGREGKTCDATKFVKKMCHNKTSCSFKVINNVCGDPVRNRRKYLKIAYSINGSAKWAGFWEFSNIQLKNGILSTKVNILKDKWYVCAVNGGGNKVHFGCKGGGFWEDIYLVPLGENKVALRFSSGHYLSAANGGGSDLKADKKEIGSWETFTLIHRGKDKFALKTFNGHYLCAENGGGSQFTANRKSIGSWETFQIKFK